MTLSDKLFYLAGVTEPYGPTNGYQNSRRSPTRIDRAMLMAIQISTDHLDRTGEVVGPDTYALRGVADRRERGLEQLLLRSFLFIGFSVSSR